MTYIYILRPHMAHMATLQLYSGTNWRFTGSYGAYGHFTTLILPIYGFVCVISPLLNVKLAHIGILRLHMTNIAVYNAHIVNLRLCMCNIATFEC